MVKNSEAFKRALLNQLRKRVSDPATGRFGSVQSQSFNGTGSATSFTLSTQSGSLLWIESVVVDSVTLRVYTDFDVYFGDSSNKGAIVFHTAPGVGTNNVVVTWYQGENWIYPDEPAVDAKYPRISVRAVGGPEESIGGFSRIRFKEPSYRIGVHVKKDPASTFTINSQAYAGGRLADYLNQKVESAVESIANSQDIYELIDAPRLTEAEEVDADREFKIISTYRTLRMRYSVTYS